MLVKNPVRTSKKTPHFAITETNWLTLFKFNPGPACKQLATENISISLENH
jgi:hypothetical protein